MAELADALDLGSSGVIRGGSIPLTPTTLFFNDLRVSREKPLSIGYPECSRKIITSNREIDGKNVELKLKFPFQEVSNYCNFANGSPHRDRPRKKIDELFDKLVEYFSSEGL